jgi:hypothetical protein
MSHQPRTVLPAALLSIGLSGLSGHASEVVTNRPVPRATNVVAQRIVGDVLQTLLEVAPAGQPAAPAEGARLPTPTPAPGSVPSSGSGSNAAWALALKQPRAPGVTLLTNTFAGFIPGSLAQVVWAGFHTNGRTTRMWELAQLPPGWPNRPPVLRWNTNSLLWGRKGMTAICQVHEDMGSFGQCAITAVTRRHGYMRGHDMGPGGLQPQRVGRRIWFCTRDNQVIERKVQFLLVRAREKDSPGDYSIILFDADLPPGIEPMRVMDPAPMQRKYFFGDTSHKPLLWALQNGRVSGGIPGWIVGVGGGDSGAPVMLPLPDEVIFFGGVTCSGPSPRMQIDLDLLSLRAGLDPSQYQMEWVNLDVYPDF